ncbi:MFS transporter [Robertkochia flava]|uniref:MFS transporter n=1 Tax=Robertkochia flava TaxID=3447986 RepID=UPI001CCE8963|nr:MFS transporter [Robertkochia marina]
MPAPTKKSVAMIVLVMLTFFLISFATNILNAIITEVKTAYSLSLTATGLLPFSFFVAYGIMSIPAGYLADSWSSKKIISLALLAIGIASAGFVFLPEYKWFLLTLFLLGSSMAVLQVVINPLLRISGGSEHFAFYSLLAQLVFGGASFLSPLVYQKVVHTETTGIWELLRSFASPQGSWTAMYLIFSFMAFALFLWVRILRFPAVECTGEEKQEGWDSFKKLFRNKYTYLFFLGIFAYVGVEQGIGNWISPFLQEYHGIDPQGLGAETVSMFWGMLTLGCVLGLLLVKIMDSRVVLAIFTMLSLLSLVTALLGKRDMALYAFPACGFFISVMWSVIFSLGLNSVKESHGSLSGILCTGIAGGAFVPLIVGVLGEGFGLRNGMFFLILPLLYILSIGFWANPLIRNKTLGSSRKSGEAHVSREVISE